MKKFRKIMSLALAAVLATSMLVGCSGSKDSTADSGKYVIGSLGPLTGEAASYGNSVKNGAEIAIAEINEAGGVKVGDATLQLELKFADDEAAADKAITGYNSLMDEGMNAFMGCVTSDSCIAVTDLTSEDGILQLTPSGSAIECTQYDNCFRLCFTDPLQGETMADYAINTMGIKKVAIIYNNADPYSSGIMEAFEAKLTELGGEVVANEAFTTGNEDFNTQLTTIKGTDAEAIFVPAYYSDVTYIATQAKALGMTLPFIGSDGWDGVLNTITDASAVEGAIFLSPFFADDSAENVQSFVTKYKENYDAVPDQFAADGYDCVYVIKAALEQAGTTDNEAVIAAMTEISVDGLTGDGISFTAEGEPEKGARFIKIVDGAYTSVE